MSLPRREQGAWGSAGSRGASHAGAEHSPTGKAPA